MFINTSNLNHLRGITKMNEETRNQFEKKLADKEFDMNYYEKKIQATRFEIEYLKTLLEKR